MKYVGKLCYIARIHSPEDGISAYSTTGGNHCLIYPKDLFLILSKVNRHSIKILFKNNIFEIAFAWTPFIKLAEE